MTIFSRFCEGVMEECKRVKADAHGAPHLRVRPGVLSKPEYLPDNPASVANPSQKRQKEEKE